MKKYFGKIALFSIGIASVFAFKAPESSKTKDSRTRWTYNSSNHIPANCVQVTCTNTVESTLCSISGLFTDASCQTTASNDGYKYQPPL